MIEKTLPLGATNVRIAPLGIGAWAWGDRFYWGYGRQYGETESEAAFQACLAAGVNFFDTAEAYGQGRSERLLGQFIERHAAPSNGRARNPEEAEAWAAQPAAQDVSTNGRLVEAQPLVVATKFAPLPWRLFQNQLERALRGSLKRLDMEQVGLYQIHFPFHLRSIETWATGLAEVVQAGLAQAVGVSNYNTTQMERAQETLQKHGVPLASNQLDYSLLNREIESSGLLETCRRENITVIAYSPLGQGLLTGKYTPDNPPGGIRGRRYGPEKLRRLQPLIRLMTEIGAAHGGKTPAQVALNWTMCKGTVPIPGAKNARQAQENLGALGWRLNDDEVARLDEASAAVQ